MSVYMSVVYMLCGVCIVLFGYMYIYIYIYIIIIYVCYSLSVASALCVLHIPYTVDSIIKNIRDGPFTIPIMNDVMVAIYIYSYVFR